VCLEGRLDLSRLHPVPTDLHLVVDSAQELQGAALAAAYPVPAAIPAATVAYGERAGRQVRLGQITGGQPDSRDEQFAELVPPARRAVGADHLQIGTGDGPSDRQKLYVVVGTDVDDVAGGVDRRLCGPVQVGDPCAGSEQVEPPADVRGRQCLTSDVHPSQCRQVRSPGPASHLLLGRRQQLLPQRRDGAPYGDPRPLHVREQQFGVASQVLRHGHHGGADQERCEQLAYGGVEARRRRLGQAVLGAVAEGGDGPVEVVLHRPVSDGDRLGAPGGSGGEDDVRDRLGLRRGHGDDGLCDRRARQVVDGHGPNSAEGVGG
jgi:hypothetical protein